MVAEQRAFDIQQVDFRDRFMVFNALSESNISYDVSSDVITESLAIFDNLPSFSDKMRSLCTNDIFSDKVIQIILHSVPVQYDMFYKVLGPATIIKLGYQKSKLIEEYKRILNNESLDELIKESVLKRFLVGERYPTNVIKAELKSIYEAFGYNKAAKATTLHDYFEMKEVFLHESDSSKSTRGFEILAIKQKGE